MAPFVLAVGEDDVRHRDRTTALHAAFFLLVDHGPHHLRRYALSARSARRRRLRYPQRIQHLQRRHPHRDPRAFDDPRRVRRPRRRALEFTEHPIREQRVGIESRLRDERLESLRNRSMEIVPHAANIRRARRGGSSPSPRRARRRSSIVPQHRHRRLRHRRQAHPPRLPRHAVADHDQELIPRALDPSPFFATIGIGTWCCVGPNSRDSGYYATKAEAQRALDAGTYVR